MSTETVTQTAPTVEKIEAPSTATSEDLANRIYLGNLPNKVTGDQIKTFLEDFTVERVTIPRSHNKYFNKRRSNIFAFVSLSSKEEAEKAVSTMNGKTIDNRTIAVKVANPEKPEEKEKTARKRAPRKSKKPASKDESETSESTSTTESKDATESASTPATSTSTPKAKKSKKHIKRERVPDDISHTDTIFVSNIPYNTTNEQLAEHFKDLNPVWGFVVTTTKRNKASDRYIKFVYGFVKFNDTESQQKAIAKYADKALEDRKLRISAVRERKPNDGENAEAKTTTETEAATEKTDAATEKTEDAAAPAAAAVPEAAAAETKA